jgi:hypothetical protein
VVYGALKAHVKRSGGFRLSHYGGLRDQIVDLCVVWFPLDCAHDWLEEVLVARVALTVRTRRPGMAGIGIIALVVRPVCRIVAEWYLEKSSHQLLMRGWNAQANPDISP